jgi:hypothetical protein
VPFVDATFRTLTDAAHRGIRVDELRAADRRERIDEHDDGLRRDRCDRVAVRLDERVRR